MVAEKLNWKRQAVITSLTAFIAALMLVFVVRVILHLESEREEYANGTVETTLGIIFSLASVVGIVGTVIGVVKTNEEYEAQKEEERWRATGRRFVGSSFAPISRDLQIDEKQGVVIGWRAWSLIKTFDGWRLGSPKIESVCTWPCFEPFTAICLDNEHEAPSSQCYCGIYAYREQKDVVVSRSEQEMMVYGQVSLWGTVIEHKDGYRAQFAYPKTLFPAGGNAAQIEAFKEICRNYGIGQEVKNGSNRGALANYEVYASGKPSPFSPN